MTNNTITNVPRELPERAWRALANSATGREIGAYLDADPCAPECAETCARASMCSTCSADLSAPSPAGVDGLEVETYLHTMHMELGQTEQFCSKWKGDPFGIAGEDYSSTYAVTSDPLCRLSDAQAIIDGLRREAARLREERDSFQRIGIRQIEHRYQLAALLLEKFPRIDPHHPITLSEVDHCCEYVLHKDRERLHCAIDAALSAGKEG